MKILFACGGSGGHVYPALAMAEIIRKKHPSDVVCFAGRKNSLESKTVQKSGYSFFEISIEGLRRKISCQSLRAVLKAFCAPSHAKKIIAKEKIDLVIATGGYVSYPFVKAAHALSVPSLLFEANAIPGLAFRLCEKYADTLLLQFEECLPLLRYPKKAKVIGAPLRYGFSELSRQKARSILGIPSDAFLFLSFGGSLGAVRINQACTQAMPLLEKHRILHVHACGERYFGEFKDKNSSFVRKRQLLPYIDEMPLYMAASNLILCRAGAGTLAELANAGRAAIAIPSPNVSADHQSKNAAAYAKKGALCVLKESELSTEVLVEKVLAFRHAPREILRLEENIKKFDNPYTDALFLDAVEPFRKPK